MSTEDQSNVTELRGPVPAIGRIVHYTITEQDADAINGRRRNANPSMPSIVHVGNKAEAGHVYPMIIARVWGDQPHSSVNGQVFLDGNDTLWVTSVQAGEGPGKFVWPMGR